MPNVSSPIFLTVSFLVLLCSCTPLSLGIPTVVDESVESFLKDEALRILTVSENASNAGLYQFHLAKFRREDILGLSVGKHHIFISYELSRLAYEDERYRWLFRHTLAHEIAHGVLGNKGGRQEPGHEPPSGLLNRISADDLGLIGTMYYRPYSIASELEADKKGMEYWEKLGWDCRIWIRIFQDYLDRGYVGDVDHPTIERLEQAKRICHPGSLESGRKSARILAPQS